MLDLVECVLRFPNPIILILCSACTGRKWILNQLKLSPDDDADILKDLGAKDEADDSVAKRGAGNYDISDDEGSSDSENDKQPVDLDEAAQARKNVFKMSLFVDKFIFLIYLKLIAPFRMWQSNGFLG